MIINSVCNSCLQTYTILLEAGDMHLMKEIADEEGHSCLCPRLCGGRINLIGDPRVGGRLREPLSLTGKELYQAVNGLGLADEIPKNKEVIKALLIAGKVTDVILDEFNGRFFINEIVLDSGVRIHMSAGLRGAQVLKITKEA